MSFVSLGSPTDPEATGDGTLLAVTKRNRTLLDQIRIALVGTLIVAGAGGGAIAVAGPLTDAQLRASAVPVSFPSGVDVSDRAARLVGVVTATALDVRPLTPATDGVDVTPAVPLAADYLPVRLTDGTNFYVAGAGGGGGTVQQGARDASAQAWLVDGSAVTQPVTGTVTANAGSGTFTVSCISGCSSAVTPATFIAYYDRIAPAANKYMATLFNTSVTRKVVVQRVVWVPNQFSAVTGVVHDMYLAHITARTAGTTVTIRAVDQNDTLSSGISADSNSTAVTEGWIWKRFIGTSEESPVTVTSLNTYWPNTGGVIVYERREAEKGITLRQNQGLTARTLTSSTVGSLSFVVVFTDEAA